MTLTEKEKTDLELQKIIRSILDKDALSIKKDDIYKFKYLKYKKKYLELKYKINII